MAKALTPEEKRIKREAELAAKPEVTPNVIRSTTQRETRAKRKTFNGTEGKLRVNHEIEGYHLHIFNDTPGRIDQALDVGYEFVSPNEVGGVGVNTVSRNTDIGDKIRFLVGTDGNNPQYAYLMKIRKEFYDEDQQAIQERVDATDAAIRQGKLTKEGHTTEGFYVPREGIRIK